MSIIETIAGKEIFVTGIEFGEDEVLIQFQEKRDIADTVAITKQMVVLCDTEERQIVYVELQEALADLVDDGYLSLRSTDY